MAIDRTRHAAPGSLPGRIAAFAGHLALLRVSARIKKIFQSHQKNIIPIKKIGGIPNSRNVLFLQIFLKRAAKPSAGNTFSGTLLNLTWLCTKASQAFSRTFSETRWTWLGFAPRLPGTFSGTFSGTLLNLTWLCTKASQTFSTLLNLTWLHQSLPDLLRDPVETDLALH